LFIVTRAAENYKQKLEFKSFSTPSGIPLRKTPRNFAPSIDTARLGAAAEMTINKTQRLEAAFSAAVSAVENAARFLENAI
jgi:hypothetical protein